MLSLIFTFCVLGFSYKIRFHRSDAQATDSSNKPYSSMLLNYLKLNFPLLNKSHQISITSTHWETLLNAKRALMTHHQDSLNYAGDRNRTLLIRKNKRFCLPLLASIECPSDRYQGFDCCQEVTKKWRNCLLSFSSIFLQRLVMYKFYPSNNIYL